MAPTHETEAARLHEADEPRLRDYGLYSMMDLLGGQITCDFCGRWQRLPTLFPSEGERLAKERNWQKTDDDKDCCPICARALMNGGEKK